MKAATIFSIFATALGASLPTSSQNYVLRVTDLNDQNIGNLTSLHSGAGFNYYFLNYPDSTTEVYTINSNGQAQLDVNFQYPFNVGTQGDFLAVGPSISPITLDIQNEQIVNYNFAACYNVNDPYDYSKNYRAIVLFQDGETISNESNCIPVRIFIDPEVTN